MDAYVCRLCGTTTRDGVHLTGYRSGALCGATACAVFLCDLCWELPINTHLRAFDSRLTEPPSSA